VKKEKSLLVNCFSKNGSGDLIYEVSLTFYFKKQAFSRGFNKRFQNFSKTIITPNYAIFDAQDE